MRTRTFIAHFLLLLATAVRSAPVDLNALDTDALSCAILSDINKYRERFNVRPLVLDLRLLSAAQFHSWDLGQNCKKLQHDSCNGLFWGERIAKYYPWTYIEEAVARSTRNHERVIEAWVARKDDNATLLDPSARVFGVGYYNGYWTADFGNDDMQTPRQIVNCDYMIYQQ